MSRGGTGRSGGSGTPAFLAQSAAGAAALVGVHAAAKAAERNLEVSDLQQKLLDCLGGPWPEPCDLRPHIRETIRRRATDRFGDLRSGAGRSRSRPIC